MSLQADIRVTRGSLGLDVALHVKPGEVLALLGPNGAGKTTLLRCLAGLDDIDSGSVVVDGEAVDDPAAGVFLPPEGRSIGFMFQDHALFEHMSVTENVAFGLRARGAPKADARRRAQEWIGRVGLADHAASRPRMLSGGQGQRVALARALVTKPRVLLLDEPLAALDVGTRDAVRRELRRHLDEFDGMTVLVTHDPLDAYALADRVAIIDSGQVVQTGTLADVTAHPRSRYVADLAGVNLVSGVVTAGVLVTDSGARVVIADAPDGPAFAVIRPTAIIIERQAPVASSARNTWHGTLLGLDRFGDRVRLSIGGELTLVAEVTAAAVETLALRPGDEVITTVKATDIDWYPA